ncbi:YMGG-like glycine zipper-containing protein [Ensifer adhaerens]|uniref:YMGG-like glycine zipper-containing protein n=1 Tax=Ensifer adhaerens TaxID=106592 RepID=UPI000CF184BA|nr:YMGG-like glycine zipper-containing protein [Ensifer adhaerens]
MKKLLLCILAGLALASCSPTQQGAGIGAATGAVVGGAIRNDVRGAAVGAAIGGVSGAIIGNVAGQPGQCRFRDRRTGREYVGPCPR